MQHLIGAAVGLNKRRVVLDILNQSVGILRKPEEIALLLNQLHGAAAVRADAARLLHLTVEPEALAGGAVVSGVFRFIDVALVVELLKHLLHGLDMIVVRGADELIIGDIQQFPEILESRNDLVYILLRGNARRLGLALNLLAVLVRTGQKERFIAALTLVAGDGVGRDGAVGVSDVQVRARIIDRCRDIKCLLLFHWSLPPQYLLMQNKKRLSPSCKDDTRKARIAAG